MTISWLTAVLCLMGWLLHWLFGWGVVYKQTKKGFVDYIDDDPPAFWVSVVSTVALYLIGPVILTAFSITLPVAFEDPKVQGMIAFFLGLLSDFFVDKGRRMFKPRTEE